jgi:hypothetical protein
VDLAAPSERLGNDGINSRCFRLSWDSFACAPQPTLPSRVYSSLTPEHRTPFDVLCPCATSDTRDSPRQLASTRSACSDLVVSHHLVGLLRVTALDVLQSKPAGVRCVAGNPDPYRLPKQTQRPKRNLSRSAGTLRRTCSIDSRHHLSMTPCPLVVASCSVPTRRSFPNAWPTSGLCSVDAVGPCHSPLPARGAIRVLPWASISAESRLSSEPESIEPKLNHPCGGVGPKSR